jgi:valyl-tRNA synthetase
MSFIFVLYSSPKNKPMLVYISMNERRDNLKNPYEPKESEARILARWEESGYSNPDKLLAENIVAADAPVFSMVLPPPNVTGILHMGSALMIVIEDILTRHARMRGHRTLWVPGTDSAAIATQARVEREIQKNEGKSRYDLGREELLRRIDAFVEENKMAIIDQIRRMGASLDWSRYAYTMDEERYRAVMIAFVRMYEAGLIYRGNRIVNWDPKGQTVISDDEVEYEECEAVLYTFRYWKDFPIPIATTRPETKVGDTAVAVHPDDPRYRDLIGKTFQGKFAGVTLSIHIVGDEGVDKEFGTGALGVTPAHSHADWDIAERYDLPRPQVIDERARMTEGAGSLVAGKKTLEAREIIVSWLREQELLEKEERVVQNISLAQRTGGTIEPLPKLQWFIAVNKPFTIPYSAIPGIASGSETTLKEMMRKVVESGAIKLLPERFEKIYFHWIDNLRDWCISRQIWFGHRIPIWYRGDELYCGLKSPQEDGTSGAAWEQDSDVLDTWFSSALWTFSTLGWPDKTKDLSTHHPTTLLETGYDILPFWVARMILMSGFHLGEVPFRTVYLHGLVRDEKGRKISKSLGNNIDPVEMAEKFGTDAVRMSLIVGTAPGADSKISEQKIKAYKHFANKLWNIARFIVENTTDILDEEPDYMEEDRARLAEHAALVQEVTADLERYQLHLAAEKLYHYIWHTFADVIIEASKTPLRGTDAAARSSAQWMLNTLLRSSLKLLHPFMPFVTEEIWSLLARRAEERDLLMVERWPN